MLRLMIIARFTIGIVRIFHEILAQIVSPQNEISSVFFLGVKNVLWKKIFITFSRPSSVWCAFLGYWEAWCASSMSFSGKSARPILRYSRWKERARGSTCNRTFPKCRSRSRYVSWTLKSSSRYSEEPSMSFSSKSSRPIRRTNEISAHAL